MKKLEDVTVMEWVIIGTIVQAAALGTMALTMKLIGTFL